MTIALMRRRRGYTHSKDLETKGVSMIRRAVLQGTNGAITVTITKEMAERHGLSLGDECVAIEYDRGILLNAGDPVLERALTVYAHGAHRYDNALRELTEES